MSKKEYTFEEIKKHNKQTDLWLLIHEKVYDVTQFVPEHPGKELILDGGGKDSTDLFEDIGHSNKALELLKNYYIGDLKKA